MNRFTVLAVFMLYVLPSNGQRLVTNNDQLQAINLGSKLKGIFESVHKDFVKGRITAYTNDSFSKIMTPELYKRDFLGAEKENMFAGWGATFTPLTDFSSIEQKRVITAFSPQYQLNIDGQDIGTFSHYSLKASDIEARLNKDEFEMLVTLINLSEHMASNNPVINTSFVFKDGEILLDSLPYPKSPKLDEWTHGYKQVLLLQKDLEPIIDAVSNTLIENLNDALAGNSAVLPCYLDKKRKVKIEHYGRHKPFAQELKTYKENPSVAGNYIEEIKLIWPRLDNLEEVYIDKGMAELKMQERTVYMVEEDLKKELPAWMVHVLSNN
ncbi:MAG: hypothetical protein JXQ87_11950 [Bacteroidia bacterium]